MFEASSSVGPCVAYNFNASALATGLSSSTSQSLSSLSESIVSLIWLILSWDTGSQIFVGINIRF
ncbi:hypothetical protein BpHYR1_017191 [Brachionus plicatilis]|uniref:Uncharacterized protein n=1 Tax=Brachionus plicatilis TaxID=10195 RepID=A0A3M7QJP2_BRAPC|nr:hypothetical protein BpHYR1_017191 [Brachionus plicatilis]